MDKIINNVDCIVIGAGPSGIAAAITVARSGKKVILIDRSEYPGSKNMYGGAVYKRALEELFCDDIQNMPYERIINDHTWAFLNDEGVFNISYNNPADSNAFAIKRFDLDSWMVNIAKKEGVYYIPSTLVTSLIIKDKKVVGIKTELEEYFAPVTIIANGANTILLGQAGLRKKDLEPKDVILTIKETLKLDKKTIEDRFNLKEDGTTGKNMLFFGSDFGNLKQYNNLFMMTFLFTFKDTIMLGVGCNLEDLKKNKLNINYILDEVKKHPVISQLIKDTKSIEYSAHIIPEGGFYDMPKLVSDGVMVAGDAAGFINGVHFEGTNFALISGKLAGETALDAIEKNDFSKNMLNNYIKRLEKSFIFKDLYTYRNVINLLHKRANSISVYYPNKIKEFFEIITGANNISKSQQYRKFLTNFIKERNILELFKDAFCALRCALDMLFGK